jgi:dATP pyrophosphohydrolase
VNVRYDMVACYVVRPTSADHEFLLLRRSPGEVLAGAWSVVRGTSEPGETAWAAAARELREETSLVPVEFYQLDTVDVFYLVAGDTIWNCPGFCAIVDPAAEIVLDHEHDAYRWVSRDQIVDEVLWPGERIQVTELCRAILDNGPAKKHLRIDL